MASIPINLKQTATEPPPFASLGRMVLPLREAPAFRDSWVLRAHGLNWMNAKNGTAQAHFNKAFFIFRSGERDDKEKYLLCIEECKKAIECDPKFLPAYALIAKAISKSGAENRSGIALEYADEAVKLHEGHNELKQRGRTLASLNLYADALRDFLKAIELCPNDSELYFFAGRCFSRIGCHEMALKLYAESLRLNPDEFKARQHEANSLLALGRHEDALPDLDFMVGTTASGHETARRARGITFYAMSQLLQATKRGPLCRKALEELEFYLGLGNRDSYALFISACCHIELHNYQEASATLNEIILKLPQTMEKGKSFAGRVYHKYGFCQLKTGEESGEAYKILYLRALNHMHKALELIQDDGRLFYDIGSVHLHLGNFDKAEESFSKAVSHSSNFVLAYLKLGFIKLRKGEFREALSFYAKALQIRPQDPVTLFHLGEAYTVLNLPVAALRLFKKAIELNPSNYRAHTEFAKLYALLGDYGKADEHFKKALSINGNHYGILGDYAHFKRSMGEYEEALDILNRVFAARPDRAFPHMDAALCHYALGNFPEGRKQELLWHGLKGNRN